ncbi:glutathione-dependent formaldehyde-activating enzyme [Xylariales sp. AK1849]|nr:glutathione-dependent formaldehyde-activating enzyme [Xylariales sp. AK1849]
MTTAACAISCHCGAASQMVAVSNTDSSSPGINVCHCRACRHSTGLLCVSYMRLRDSPLTEGLKAFESSDGFQRYFCTICGCHVFWCYSDDKEQEKGKVTWAVATGIISERLSDHDEVKGFHGEAGEAQYTTHINVAGTKDGGLSSWIDQVDGRRMAVYRHCGPGDSDDAGEILTPILGGSSHPEVSAGEKPLGGFCHCGTVRFHITRPDAASHAPRSKFPDLMIPYHIYSPQIANPGDSKWWLRPEGTTTPTHYLAGTCACRSCRLTSGFEIQTWAFIPRSNIFFHIPTNSSLDDATNVSDGVDVVPLDFSTLPPGILRSYESSPGVLRESCRKCGATVFWHDKRKPQLTDVSVGLLEAPEGARAGNWLEWWTGRVSFSEDAGNGRSGAVEARANGLIEGLKTSLKAPSGS